MKLAPRLRLIALLPLVWLSSVAAAPVVNVIPVTGPIGPATADSSSAASTGRA